MNNRSRAQRVIEEECRLLSTKRDEILTEYRALPNINRALEITEWERDTISGLPDEEIDNNTIKNLESEISQWQSALSYGSPDFYPATTSALGSNISGSSKVYDLVHDYSKRDPENEWPKIQLSRYQDIQKSQNVEGIVRSALKTIKQIKPTEDRQRPIVDLFDVAMEAIEHAKAGAGTMSAAGIEMRTVLEQFKGTLFYRSSASKGKGSKEQRREEVANFLTKNGKGSSEYVALVKELKTHDQLKSDLSELAKRTNETNFEMSDFDSLVTRFLNHLGAVLNFLDLDKLR